MVQAFHITTKNQGCNSMNDKELILENRVSLREWLESEGSTSDSVWLIFSKTHTFKTLSAHEALEEALCFGWIDGQMQSIDEDKYRKYFARRKEQRVGTTPNKARVNDPAGVGCHILRQAKRAVGQLQT